MLIVPNTHTHTKSGETELKTDIYLVASVVRLGKIHVETLKKSDKPQHGPIYRRPFGVGVIRLADLIAHQNNAENQSEYEEHNLQLHQCDEKDFHQLHEMLIKGAGKYSAINANGTATYGIGLSAEMMHGDLMQLRAEQPVLLQSAAVTRKLGFPDIIMPGDVRNDLFFVLDRGEFERGGKTTGKNIDVLVSIIDAQGKVVTECLRGASSIDSTQTHYRSLILYHNNAPQWNETFRLDLPLDKYATCHVRFEYRHCSTRDKTDPKLFAFSFARLMKPSGAAIADGQHELYVYKCEEPSKLTKQSYLKLKSSAFDEQGLLDQTETFHRTSKECMYIRSLLISTKLTQNDDILSILQWKTHPERIKQSLTQILNLADQELIKFLQDILDALFALFSDENGDSTDYSGIVFQVLVSIFGLLQESKFKHFKPVLDEYIENHFAAPLVYKGLIASVQHLAERLVELQHVEPVPKYFNSLEYVVKLIIKSRKLFAQATGGEYEEQFRRNLFDLFASLSRVLAVPSYEAIVQQQEALLRSVGVILEQLQDTLPATDIGILARNMFDAVGRNAPRRLIRAKLHAVKDFISGRLFHEDVSRSVILAVACKHIRMHLSHGDEVRLTAEILAEILNSCYKLSSEQSADRPSNFHAQDLNVLSLNILDILMQTIWSTIEAPPELAPLVSTLLGLLQQMDESLYTYLFNELEANGALVDFLTNCFRVFKHLLLNDWHIFQADWIIMKLLANDILRQALEEFAKPLVYRFLDKGTFNIGLWCDYFSLAVAFLTQPCLQIETYPDTKRRKILNEFKDMRVLVGFQILSMWSQLGEQKLRFIPSMVGPFLEVSFVPDPALRKATLTVFYDMIQCEQVCGRFWRQFCDIFVTLL